MKHHLFWSGLAMAWLIGATAGAETLEDAWQAALSTDQRIHAARDKVAAANFSLESAQRRYRPSITNKTRYTFLSEDANFSFAGNTFRFLDDEFATTSLTATMPLYTGGRIAAGVDAASCQSNAAGWEVQRTRLDIKLNVVVAYVMVLRAQRGVQVAQSSVRSLEAQDRVVQSMLKQGAVPRNDLLAVQVELANARQQLIRAENRLANTRATYNRVLGRPLEYPVDLAELLMPETSDTPDWLVERGIQARPELAALAAQANALQHQAAKERAELMPQVGVEGGLFYLESPAIKPNDYATLMFGMEWTPYDGGVAEAKARSLQSEASAVIRTRADTLAAIRLEIQNAWRDEQESRKRIELAQKAIEQAEENLRVAKVRFEQGAAINTEVLDAESLRTRTYDNYYDAIYEAILATFRLRRAAGTL